MKKITLLIAVCSMTFAVVVSLRMHARVETDFRENAVRWTEQSNELAQLSGENQRLASLNAEATTNVPGQPNPTAELATLRAMAEGLREETTRLASEVAQAHRRTGATFYSTNDYNLLEHNREARITFRGGPRETGRLNDARVLADALLKYAEKHEGTVPQNFADVTTYLPKPLQSDTPGWENAPLSGTNHFPLRRVALLREQVPWQTPDGKWARTYAYADGAASIVESDDNFQSWEAQHLVPRDAAR